MVTLLHNALENSAERNPDREAFKFLNASIPYADFSRQTDRLAGWLHHHGVREGDRVAILTQRSMEGAVAVYGILKAGAAFVPLDPFSPPATLAEIVVKCGINHIITHSQQTKAALRLKQAVLALDGQTNVVLTGVSEDQSLAEGFTWAMVEEAGLATPAVSVREDDLAYIIHTSGSTGIPKGIMHTHASGLAYARLTTQTYGIRPDDRIASHSPLHFDMATLGHFSGPYAGATTVLIPEPHTKMPASLSQLVEDERITIWYSVPFALTQLLARGALDQRKLDSLRWVLYAGEAFPPRQLHELMRQWPQARFSNVYGPAETNQCTYFHIPRIAENMSDELLDRAIPIGQTWDETEALILSDDDVEAAPGEVGELVIHTSTMMSGYWEQPELNERVFLDWPANGEVAKKFYRTGDLVQRSDDEVLLFLGRKDRQIKTRGHRVELDAVELALLACPEIEEGVVFEVVTPDGTCRIDAAYVGKKGIDLDQKTIAAFLAKKLPPYALPSEYWAYSQFPRTATGKVDRLALKKTAE